MNRLALFVGRYGLLLLLWLGFAPIIAFAARNPGFVPNPGTVPYPWRATLVTWGLLGLESAVLFWLIRSPRRLPVAFGLALLLLGGSLVATPTDLPGYAYVPGQYHLVLVVSLGLAWATRAMTSRRNRSLDGSRASVNTLALRIQSGPDDDGSEVRVLIDGRDLVDLAREAETPFTRPLALTCAPSHGADTANRFRAG